MKEHTVADLAYAAGIIDGEGSIMIVLQAKRHAVLIAVGNTDERMPAWLHARWGGRIHEVRQSWGHFRRMTRWRVTHRLAVEFLAEVLPYLVTKREQAEVALEFGRTIGNRRPVPMLVVARRESLRQEMRRLNLRGAAALAAQLEA